MKEEEREAGREGGGGKEEKTAQLSSTFHFCEKSVLSVANEMERSFPKETVYFFMEHMVRE